MYWLGILKIVCLDKYSNRIIWTPKFDQAKKKSFEYQSSNFTENLPNLKNTLVAKIWCWFPFYNPIIINQIITIKIVTEIIYPSPIFEWRQLHTIASQLQPQNAMILKMANWTRTEIVGSFWAYSVANPFFSRKNIFKRIGCRHMQLIIRDCSQQPHLIGVRYCPTIAVARIQVPFCYSQRHCYHQIIPLIPSTLYLKL